MKHATAIVATLFSLCSVVASPAAGGLRVGAAHVKITPPGPVPMAGYGARWGGLGMKKSTGVHDDLYARAIVVEKGDTKFALVACDLCAVNAGLRKAACRVLAKADTGIAEDNVMVCGTHTHAGTGGYILSLVAPPVAGFYNPKILKKLSSGIAEAVVLANAKLAPATFGVAAKDLDGYNRNRRGRKTVDRSMTVLRFDGKNGKPIALMINFTAHPTILGGGDMELSRGWPGAMVDAVRDHFGDDTEVLFCNGALGDASPVADGKPKNNYKRAVKFGKKIARPAIAIAEGIRATKDPDVKVVFNRFELPPSALKVVASSKSWAHRIEIGKTWLMGLPGEAIMRIGLDIKAKARELGSRNPVIVGLADDHLMYFVTREVWPNHDYEVAMNMYGPTVEDTLVEAVLGDRIGPTGPSEAELMAGSKVRRGKGALFVKLSGSHYRMGYQHGKLLGKEIHAMYGKMMSNSTKLVEPEIGKVLGGNSSIAGLLKIIPGGPKRLIEPFLAILARQLNIQTPVELREEMMGIADGAGMAYDQIFWMNSLLTMTVQEDLTKLFGTFSMCTNVVQSVKGRTPTVIHARNVDWMFRDQFAPMVTVFEIHPEKGNSLLSAAFPGVVGVLTAVNDRQLTLGNETVNSHSDRSMKGMPIMTSCRMAVQYDQTLDEMVKRLVETPGTAGMHVMMGDGKSGRALAVDRSAKYAVVRKPKKGVLLGVVLGDMSKPYVGSGWKGPGITTIDEGERSKYEWIQQILDDGSVPLKTVDDWTKLLVRSDHGICVDSTIHATVMVPSKGELLLHRCLPDADGTYERFALPMPARAASQ